MNNNLFKSVQEISEFIASRPKPTKPGDDYAVSSLVDFPFENDELKALACAYLIGFLVEYPVSYDNLTLRRHMVRVAPFLEASGYIAAIEPLMRIRNRLEAEIDDSSHTLPEWVVATRNAIDTLILLRNSSKGT